MPVRRSPDLRFAGIALLIVATALVAHARTPDADTGSRRIAPPQPPRIDVVFVLDTTGSMSGLIEGAKRKIWSLASEMASGQPTPEIRVGLVAYRDRGDAYVTRRFGLTEDLDAVHASLQSLRADGGGDTPESVNQALDEAVTEMAWRPGQGVYRVVFLVGDAPPHMDYPNETRYPSIARQAAARGIVINTVQCGDLAGTASVWRAIASAGGGAYASIAQDGAMLARTTPVDDELARLNRDLAGTAIPWGSGDEKRELERKLRRAAASAPEVAADRLRFLDKKGGRVNLGRKDLLDAVKQDEVDVAVLPKEALPAPMRDLDADGRRAYVERQQERREELQKAIRAKLAERERHLAASPAPTTESFDAKVMETVREQAASAGITYE